MHLRNVSLALAVAAAGFAPLTPASLAQGDQAVSVLLTLKAEQPVWECAFTPDGQKLVVVGENEEVQFWHLRDRKVAHLRGHNRGLIRVAMSPDGRRFASAGQDTHVVVWNTESREEEFSLKKHLKAVKGLAFSPDGRHLASGSEDFMVYLWDLESRKPHASLEGYGPISYLAYAPNGSTVALGTLDGRVAVWDTAEPRKVLLMPLRHEKRVYRLAYSPDCKTLVSTDVAGTLIFWEVETGKVLAEKRGIGAQSLAFSPSGRTLAIGHENGVIRLLDAAGEKEKALLKGHEGKVTMLTYMKDGKAIASCSDDRTVRIWNVSEVVE
jgi:WD40 repeat protein